MFYSLRGKLIVKDGLTVAVECAGVGYKCNVTQSTLSDLPNVGEPVFLYTHLNVREDAMELFGFSTLNELNCFKLLTLVSGVGMKVAVAILSTLSSEQVAIAIASADSKALTMAPGVGNKLAQRIILELKDKVESLPDNKLNNGSVVPLCKTNFENANAAVNALTVLGYSRLEASQAVANFNAEALSVEELIKNALKVLGGRK